ncbi:MAG: PorV/PorQ family protein [Candidatus Stygibacter frigidus]|nr:PorV/PorQ family protein [Candidatus Stygibacter frigidus]
MNLIKKFTLIGLFLTLLFSTIYAEDNNHAAPYMRMGLGAKALAMGSAYTAIADNISTAYWNPAGLSEIENIEIGSMYSTNMGLERQYNYAGIGMKFDFGAIALSWIHAGWEDFEGYQDGVSTGNFNVQDHNIAVSFAKGFSNFSLGANLKTYIQSMDEEVENGFGFDFGAKFNPNEFIGLGLMLRDIYGKVGEDEIPFQYSVGVSVNPKDNFTVSADLKSESSDVIISVGTEYVLGMDKFSNLDGDTALRIGLNDNHLTAGIGFIVNSIEVNYAYTEDASDDNIFEDSHRISLIMRF